MNPDQWQHVQTLFFNALKLAPDDQAAFLERECKDDAEAKAEVRALLAYRTKLGNFVDETAIEDLDKTYGREEPAGEPDDLIGTVIADRYVVSEFVDSGAMGSVYRGIHRLLGSPVAVKRIAGRFRNRKEYRDRFVEEARKAARLNHENIAKVTDAVEQSGEIFIIMEFVEGATLRARLREPVSTAEFMDFASQCASALVAAHRERIVHLDLKPENII